MEKHLKSKYQTPVSYILALVDTKNISDDLHISCQTSGKLRVTHIKEDQSTRGRSRSLLREHSVRFVARARRTCAGETKPKTFKSIS